MKIVSLPITMREKTGSAESRRLRRDGRVPATLYGLDRPAVSVAVEARAFHRYFDHGSRMFELRLDDKTQVCLLKDVHYDALGDELLHVDFHRVDDSSPVSVSVAIEFVGEPEAVPGATLEHVGTDVQVRCLPRAIPRNIEVDQRHLKPGEHVEAKDLVLPEGVELDDLEHKTIVTYHFRHAPAGEEEAGGEEGAEPEVLSERKPEED